MPVKIKANKGSHVICMCAFFDPKNSATMLGMAQTWLQTCLGWLINGRLSSSSNTYGSQSYITSNRISVARLEGLLIDKYNQEFSEQTYSEKKELSFEYKQFLSIANNSIKMQDGHYELWLPFKRDNVSLPINR